MKRVIQFNWFNHVKVFEEVNNILVMILTLGGVNKRRKFTSIMRGSMLKYRFGEKVFMIIGKDKK